MREIVELDKGREREREREWRMENGQDVSKRCSKKTKSRILIRHGCGLA